MLADDERKLKDLLIKHEGLRLQPYIDTVGKVTIGVGRNLTDIGITPDEALVMLEHDIATIKYQLNTYFKWYQNLDSHRQIAVINMAFMGVGKLLLFKKFLAALQSGDFETAAKEMLDSKWAQQVGNRAKELSEIVRTGILT